MAKKWVEVAASPEFNALEPQQQEEARQQYWREVVAPNVPQDQLQSVQSEFDADTLPTIANPSAKPLDVEITGGQSVPAGDYAQMRQQEGAQVPYPTPTSPAANDSASARMISGQPAPQPEGNAVGRALGQIGGRQLRTRRRCVVCRDRQCGQHPPAQRGDRCGAKVLAVERGAEG